MNKTPIANRKHIVFYGKRNAGKSSLMNEIIGQEISLVSNIKGTTTDPVSKAMELIPFGPVLFIDTGGIDDEGELGDLRVKKTLKALDKTDLGIYVIAADDIDKQFYTEFKSKFEKNNTPYVVVINKIDKVSQKEIEALKEEFKGAIFVSTKDFQSILNLKDEIIKKLEKDEKEETLIGDVLPYNSKVVMVVPVDSEAPRGRLILPQVQLIRDCLDHGIKSYVVRDTELVSALEDLKDVDLVVTDSQAFKEVSKMVQSNIKLTSFSIILARYKGDLKVFLDGIHKIKELKEKENPKVLIMESCAHNFSHEDIGRIKIPKLLNKHLGKEVSYDFKMGEDFPGNLETYDLVIHCGSCMLNKKTMQRRLDVCKSKNVSITNYGIVLAYLTGILDRAVEIFI